MNNIHWQPKKAAMRDLILWVLAHEEGNTLEDKGGKVSTIIREKCDLPNNNNVQAAVTAVSGLMEKVGLVMRDLDTARKRTYVMTLVNALTPEAIIALDEAKETNVALFAEPASTDKEEDLPDEEIPGFSQLHEDCKRALTMLQQAAANAERRTEGGLVVINGRACLRSTGLPGKRVDAIKFYLRQLGNAHANHKVEDDQSGLWWWQVSDKPLNRDALLRMIKDGRTYEKHLAEKAGRPAAGPVVKRTVTPPAPAPQFSDASPGGVARDEAPSSPASSQEEPSPPQVTSENVPTPEATIARLVKVVELLEGKLADVTQERDELQARLAAHTAIDPRAAELLTKYQV